MKSHMEPDRSVKKAEQHVRVIQQKHIILYLSIYGAAGPGKKNMA
jgi:hypothetical protein